MDDHMTGDESTVTLFLDYAGQFAQAVDDSEGRSGALALLAEQYAQAGELDAAADTAERIGDSFVKDGALANVAARAVELGDDQFAEELIGAIDDPGLYALALGEMAVKYAEAGEFDRAVEAAGELDDDAPTLSRIAMLYAGAGEFERAAEVCDSIEDPAVRSATYCGLTAGALRVGLHEEAAELLSKADAAAAEIESSQSGVYALIEIASRYKELGEDERAVEALDGARRLCDDFDGTPHAGMAKSFAKDEALADLADAFAGSGRFDLAEQVADEIENAFRFASALIKLALAYHAVGRGDEASENLVAAREAVLEEEVVGDFGVIERDRLLAELAAGYLTAGDAEEALRVAGMMSLEAQRHEALKELATRCAHSGRDGMALRAAGMIEDTFARALCRLELADAFAAAGQPELSERAASGALADAEAIEHAYAKAVAFMEAASSSARRGGAPSARNLLRRSLVAVSFVRDNYHRAVAIISLASRYREFGLEASATELEILEEMAPDA
ncbi:MAG TPA: hypothetical protein VJ866_09830 [Pyrinomonadaceae bacterium]|nr:hypothetical protein [Pyrinomonadaceae bacterium]